MDASCRTHTLRSASSALSSGTDAAREATEQALSTSAHPVACVVFFTGHYEPEEVAQAVRARVGDLPTIGCSSMGVIGGGVLLPKGVVVGFIDAPNARAGVGVGLGVRDDAYDAGRRAVLHGSEALPMLAKGRCRTIVLLADARFGSAASVVRGALSEAGSGVTWAGGAVGSDLEQRRAAVLANGDAHQDAVAALVLDLPAAVGAGLAHGWLPVGPPAMVTKARGRVVHQLEYRSAYDVYEETARVAGLEVDPETFVEFSRLRPFGVPQANARFLLRDPVALTADGSLEFVGEVPDGSLVRLMEADEEAMLAAAIRAGRLAVAKVGTPGGALLFDCISRRALLGSRYARELAALRSALGEGLPTLGCLTFGEYGSFGYQVPQFHNKTVVVLALPRADPKVVASAEAT